LYPKSTVLGLVVIVPVRISAWFFLGFWFLYQLFEANFGLFGAKANGGGVAFFAHVGGFLFGVAVAFLLSNLGRVTAQDEGQALRVPALAAGSELPATAQRPHRCRMGLVPWMISLTGDSWARSPRPEDERDSTMSNNDLARYVTEELYWDPKVDSAAIAVSVDDGVVTLRGTVGSFREKQDAK